MFSVFLYSTFISAAQFTVFTTWCTIVQSTVLREFQTSSSWVFEFELELSVIRLKSSPRVPQLDVEWPIELPITRTRKVNSTIMNPRLEIACCLCVHLFVTLVDHDHIGWKSRKQIPRTISLTSSFFLAQGHPPSPGEHGKILGRLEAGLVLVRIVSARHLPRAFAYVAGSYSYCWIIQKCIAW